MSNDDAISANVQVLSRLATAKAIAWEEDVKKLPEDEQIAKLGFLADRLGIPLAVALDSSMGEEQFREFLKEEQGIG